MPKRFQLVGGYPALDFANTLDFRYEPEKSIELLESVDDLVQFASESGLITITEKKEIGRKVRNKSADQLMQSARELRECVERIFAAAADDRRTAADDLAALNGWLRTAAGHRAVQKHDSSFAWSWQKEANSGEGLLWRLAQAAGELLTSPELCFVRRCSADNCRWLFLDKSKSHSRRWCDMKICGNREKARAYYQRTTAES